MCVIRLHRQATPTKYYTDTCNDNDGGYTSTPIDVTYGDYEITLIAAEPPRPTPGSTRDDSRDEKLADDSIKPVTWDLDLIGAGIGASLKAGLLIVGKAGAKAAEKSLAAAGGKELFNFSKKAAEHMGNPARAVPAQTLEGAIKGAKGLPDPRGSDALMHTVEMVKNGKSYNLEVLYNESTNTIFHFKYFD
jgi:hypothetical protein